MDDFICVCCGELRDFHTQALIMASTQEDAQFWISGMPCVFTGFCVVCLPEEEPSFGDDE